MGRTPGSLYYLSVDNQNRILSIIETDRFLIPDCPGYIRIGDLLRISRFREILLKQLLHLLRIRYRHSSDSYFGWCSGVY